MDDLRTLKPGGTTVLVVDDSPTQLEELRFFLEDADFRVLAADNGLRALEVMRTKEIDLVITDIVMPEMDGYELCKTLRRDDKLRHVPVILLTSLSDPLDVIRGLESGADNFLRKPLEPGYLVARVRNVVDTAALRKNSLTETGLTIRFRGKDHYLGHERLQLLDALLSAFDDALSLTPSVSDGPIVGARVLVVEDSPSESETLRFLLEECGCSVCSAADGREALEILQSSPVDLVVSDVNMPEMDGYALCKAIRGDERLHDLPVVLVSGLADPQDLIYGLEAGATNFFRKPFADRHLCTRIRTLLANRAGRARFSEEPPIDVVYEGQRFSINADREQILDLLFSSYDNAVRQNAELTHALDQLQVLTEDLEARVIERTASLTAESEQRRQTEEALRASEEQLLQSQKMEAVGQLAGGIAHDFNNLLGVILGYTEMLLAFEDVRGPQAVDQLVEIKRAAERAATLTRQILAFSRRQTLQASVVSLGQVLDGLKSLLVRTIGENVDLVVVEAPDLGYTMVDANQFEQVLINLAVNARDAMPSGGRLTLETANVELDEEYCRVHADVAPGDYVMLAVSDAGIGMDEMTRKRIFEPFFTTKDPGHGTGLGLATVYGIVKQSGGNIAVQSEPGKGTCFKIYLPRVDPPAYEVDEAVTGLPASTHD